MTRTRDRSVRPLRALVDLVVPPTCASCGAGISSDAAQRLCLECRDLLAPLLKEPPRVPGAAQVICGWSFEGLLQDLVQRFKYERELPLARPLAELLVEAALGWDLEPHVVVPMPLSRARQRARSFDHAWILAGPVADALGVSRVAALARDDRPAQVGLNAEARRENPRGAFHLGSDAAAVAGRTVLLVDDVITTGATCAEAVASLREAGAASVDVLLLAHAP